MDLTIFYQLSLVIALAAFISLAARALRQPLIIGYIITGFIVGPLLLGTSESSHEAFASFSQIGIVLLLFIVGLGLNTEVIRRTGKPVLLTFMAVVAGVGSMGYIAAKLMGFSATECFIIATALLFSSTIIVVKSLVDKKEQSRLYGQIAIGILLVEDIAATVALLIVSASSDHSFTLASLGHLALKGGLLAAALFLAGNLIMPRLSHAFAESQELLYTFALAWAFGVASLFHAAGFSVEVGALFAGVALAHVPYAQEIATRLKPIRDFFVLLFFIELGSKLGIDSLSTAIGPAIVFSALIMVMKPLLTLITLGNLGYTKQTGFKSAVHLSQISEFSIILVVLAQKLELVSMHTAVAITLTALITILLSTYLMNYDDNLYQWLKEPLGIFERADAKRELASLSHYPLVLLGYRRDGYEFVKTFRLMKKRYVVVDYDPAVVDIMEHQHISHIYGDATDFELLEEISIDKSELIISTIADTQANQTLLRAIRQTNPNSTFICHAGSYEDAGLLYGDGASFVILPHFLGSEQINTFLRDHGASKGVFEKYRHQQAANLSKSGS